MFTHFDSCLRDDRVWLNHDSKKFVAANRKDGLATKRHKNLGFKVIIASTETNKVVIARGNKIGVETLQGLDNKVRAVELYLNQNNLRWNDIWYVGNDVNDLGAIKKAKVSLCPRMTLK